MEFMRWLNIGWHKIQEEMLQFYSKLSNLGVILNKYNRVMVWTITVTI